MNLANKGIKIGMKITMISVHSNGQPKMKMMNWLSSMNCSVVSPRDNTQVSISSWPPSSAKDAEKIDEPTNSQHTMALVLAVRNEDSRTMPTSSTAVLPRGLPPGVARALT